MLNKKFIKSYIDEKWGEVLDPNFKIVKRLNKFIELTLGGARIIEYRLYDDYNSERDGISIRLEIILYVRFDVIHDWFCKYEHRTKSDLKYNWTYGETLKKKFTIDIDKDNQVNDFVNQATEYLITESHAFFSNLKTLEQLRVKLIPVHIKEAVNLPSFNIRTAFEILTLLAIRKDDSFTEAVDIIKEKLIKLDSVGDPMVKLYLPKFDEIVETLRVTDFSESNISLEGFSLKL